MRKIEVKRRNEIGQDAAYKIKRAAEYPAITDQLDAIWKVFNPPAASDAAAMKARLEAIKAKYPKPPTT